MDQTRFIEGHIDSKSLEEVTKKLFYTKYLAKNVPLHVKDGAKKWRSLSDWAYPANLIRQLGFDKGSWDTSKIHKGEEEGEEPIAQPLQGQRVPSI